MSNKKGKKDKEKSKKSQTLHDKFKENEHQEKHIFDRIAAGEKVNPTLKKNALGSNVILPKSGCDAHGHILRAGEYRCSPGLQQVRLEYKENMDKSEPSKSSKKESTEKSKEVGTDAVNEVICKAAKSDGSNSKSSKEVNVAEVIRKAAKPGMNNSKSASRNKSSKSLKKSSNKQVVNLKTTDEKQQNGGEGKKADEQNWTETASQMRKAFSVMINMLELALKSISSDIPN